MIRVGIDGGDYVPGSQVRSGIHRIVSSFLREVSSKEYKKSVNINYYYFGKKGLPNSLFSSLHLPAKFIRDKNSVFIGFSGVIPSILRLDPCRKIVFIYDLGFFKYPQFYTNSQKLARNTTNSINHSDKVIVLSNYAKAQVLKYYSNIKKDKIIVIPAGGDHIIRTSSTQKLKYVNYLLYIGVIKPIKNISKVLEYYKMQKKKDKNLKLILVGDKETEYFRKLDIPEGAIFLSNVSEKNLVNLIDNSNAVINFSHEEGFCFPVLEAMRLNKKIITNNLPVYKELNPNLKWSTFTAKLLRLAISI